MDNNILVAYLSKNGATQEIAEKIAAVLHLAGLQADVLPVTDSNNLARYKAVILGSAIYIGQWQKEAVAFLRANEALLDDRLVWLFSSGSTSEWDPVDLLEGERLPSSLKPVVARIHPRDIAVFLGYIDQKKINPIEKWLVKSVVKKPFGDFRDWDSIIKWTSMIEGALKNAWA